MHGFVEVLLPFVLLSRWLVLFTVGGGTSSTLISRDSQYEFEICLSCQGLPNDSSGLAPNTYAVVQSQNEHEGMWISNGHTETVEVCQRVQTGSRGH